jgi:alpha-tubulin suppressor-like RCC1 family protein
MKIRTLLYLLILGLLPLVGCNFDGKTGGSSAINSGNAYSRAAKANVNFKIVLPKTQADLRLALPSPRAEFSLMVLNYGNTTKPYEIFRKIGEIKTDGTSTVTFSSVPAGTAIGELTLVGANIQGQKSFRGCTDLKTGTNTIELAASGSKELNDVLVASIYPLAADLVFYNKVAPNLSSQLSSVTSALSSTNASDSAQIVNAYKTYLQSLGARQVVGADAHSCAIRADDTVLTWGDNSEGQLGDAVVAERKKPSFLTEVYDVKSIFCGKEFTLALKKDGTIWGWGNNIDGPLGGLTERNVKTPAMIPNLSNVSDIYGGHYHSFAVDNSGKLWSWGKNDRGQLGHGAALAIPKAPEVVSGLTNVVSCAGGESFSLVLTSDGNIHGMGDNTYGQLGSTTTEFVAAPTQITGIGSVAEIAVGSNHCLARTTDGKVWAWGLNLNGQVGITSSTLFLAQPAQVAGLSNIVSISAGYAHSVAVSSDGKVWTWGSNSNKQLGDETSGSRYMPTALSSISGAIKVTSGGNFNFVILSNGQAKVFGQNEDGQLGNGTTTDSSTPVDLTFSWQ